MLVIDEKIKKLYHTDGISKNFRVHFPNGEMDDLNNENVVYESLSFKESICSSDSFKFGLCEAGEISFETVDVDTMIDMEIECFIEIDVSSLREWDAENSKWTNNYSGRYMSDTEVDRTGDEVERQVFSIPLGVFKVDSSPRSHSDMRHREVTAYTRTFETNEDMSGFEQWRISQLHKKSGDAGTFKMYLPQYIDSQINRTDWQNDYDEVEASTSTSVPTWYRIVTGPIVPKNNGWKAMDPTAFKITDSAYIYFGNTNAKGLRCIKSALVNSTAPMYRLVKNSTFADYEAFKSYVSGKVSGTIDDKVLYDFYENYLYSYCVTYATNTFYQVTGIDKGCVVPHDPTMASVGQLTLATTIKVLSSGSETDITPTSPWYVVKGYTLKTDSELKSITLNISSNLDTGSGTYRYSFYNSFTMKDIMSGYLELHALFGNQERNGDYTWYRLSREDPIPYTATNYKEIWWDEYDVDPIGYVLYTYKPSNGDSEDVTYQIADHATSIYDMTDNKIIEIMEGTSKSKIQTLIDQCFKGHLDPIYFTPVELTSVGLPYLEDGDFIKLTTTDGSEIETFILTRSMSGIQSLSDDITSASGDIIAGEDIDTDPDTPEE